jgi:hypothetical protein
MRASCGVVPQVRLANDLPRPLTSKAVTAKFLQQGEQVRIYH